MERIGRVLNPIDYIDIDGPCIFLAGPIRGTWDWQEEAIKIISDNDPDINIANPRISEENVNNIKSGVYGKQADWETFYLNRSADNGVIIFWLALKTHEVEGRSYAQTSRFELAEWITKARYKRVNLSIGIEKGFHGSRYIKHRVLQIFPDFQFSTTLEDTCLMAIDLIRS